MKIHARSCLTPVLRLLALAPLATALVGCVGTTGGEEFSFDAYATGAPEGAGDSFAFVAARFGYAITLMQASVHVGGLYLNRAVPTSVSRSSTTCTLAGIYSAEVPAEVNVNLLSPDLQPFSAAGSATSDPTFSAEVWLNHGDVNDPAQAPAILSVQGTAERDGVLYPFAGELSIGENRLKPPPVATPGLFPICKERIIGPFAVHLEPRPGGHLVLGIDAKSLFANVNFSLLVRNEGGVLVFDDEQETQEHSVNQASQALYAALTSTAPYAFAWHGN